MAQKNHNLDLQDLVSSQFNNVVAAEVGKGGEAEIFIREEDKVVKKEK